MNKLPGPITRRQFVRLALVSTISTLVEGACRGYTGSLPDPASTAQVGATATSFLSPSPEATDRVTELASPTSETVPTLPPLTQNTLNLLRNRNDPPMVHVILTGRNAHPLLVEIADTVTEMREVKHAYQKGIQAQRGIEY